VSLEVLLHDNHLLAVAKPAGQPCVPDESGDESLLDQAKEWVRVTYAKPGAAFLGVVHRLDRPVSGLVVFARTSKAAQRLTRAFRERSVEKVYWAIGEGRVPAGRGRVEHWLAKDGRANTVRVCAEGAHGAKLAETLYRSIAAASRASFGRTGFVLRPETGRSHQLRVACASLGSPLLGDLRYGAGAALPDRSIALHAARLAFAHPTRDEHIELELEPPARPWWDAWQGALRKAADAD
jgi:23S rRNA pseudouridine1911/1915/1917 synthase